MDKHTVEQLIRDGLPESEVIVNGDDGVHFDAEVVTSAFSGKMTLARHRMVYACLGDKMGGEIHALALKTFTPEEKAAL